MNAFFTAISEFFTNVLGDFFKGLWALIEKAFNNTTELSSDIPGSSDAGEGEGNSNLSSGPTGSSSTGDEKTDDPAAKN